VRCKPCRRPLKRRGRIRKGSDAITAVEARPSCCVESDGTEAAPSDTQQPCLCPCVTLAYICWPGISASDVPTAELGSVGSIGKLLPHLHVNSPAILTPSRLLPRARLTPVLFRRFAERVVACVITVGRIRRLHRVDGRSIKEIARLLKVSRNSVRGGVGGDTEARLDYWVAGICNVNEPRLRMVIRNGAPTVP
jgi:hypothetical protein